ncbi:hypothetical protein QVZ41_14040 [Wenyingzhuangia sp. chi5]|uniref:Uncharacterized protein n=1 Tax=Wenyingzhuangia gilva TaxID=3057677 RepID=A0ABT8VVG8_9FLAO|nr:hypothetical protein [Wenyingzhuangia sp. chi5]MDO3695968.1 hypothetical protein [Wenyingzhuangia sp. chi5]
MQKAIKNRTPIHVDLSPNRDEVYSGICLKSNDEIFIFNCFNEETKEFDGYAIIRNYEINKYREWDKEELEEINNNNSNDFVNKLPLEKMNNIFECLSELKDEKLIAIFNESDNDSYFIGKIENLSKKDVELKLLNENAEWIENENIKIKEITYIGFRTSYEKQLLNKTLNDETDF